MRKRRLVALGLAAASAPALAQQGIDEPFQKPFKEALAGKTVAFVPVAMNFDLTEGWWGGLKKELEPYGVKFELRDPNWNTNAGAQAVTELISEKPAVMVIHNPDVQTYAKLLQRAENDGHLRHPDQHGLRLSQLPPSSARTGSRSAKRTPTRSSRPARASRTRSRSCRARCRPPPAPIR